MRKRHPLFLIVLCFLVVFFIAGCAATSSGGKDSSNNGKNDSKKNDTSSVTSITPGSEKLEVVLYFAGPASEKLAPETRTIAKVPGVAKATLQELLKGPASGSKLQRTIPEGTKIIDLNIKGGLCTVNFSKEIQANHWGGSTGEMMTIYSIVNTLTQFESIEKVTFMIDGEPIETLAGHADLSIPVIRNDAIINP